MPERLCKLYINRVCSIAFYLNICLTFFVNIPDDDFGAHFAKSFGQQATKSIAATCD